MSSTYSSYKFELIGTGEQAGTWGTSTNTNLGTAIEQAIGGYVSVAFTGLTKSLTLINTSAAQDARALYLNLTGTPGGAATLEVPAIQKAYIIKNATTGGFAVTAKVSGMTGVLIPNGKTMLVYNNGTDVVIAHDNFSAPVTINANSASDALRITQTGSGNALLVEDEANPDTSPFVVDSAGRVGIGIATPGAVASLRISRRLTGATSGATVYADYTVASDVTGSAATYRSDVITDAAAFTLPFLTHYTVTGLTVGAGSTVTDQRGFNVAAAAVGATNNYGFYSAVPSGTNNWGYFGNGTAPNYMAGALGIGSTGLTGYKFRVSGILSETSTGSGTAINIFANATFDSTVNSIGYGIRSALGTAASVFTVPNLYHFVADSVSVGAGSTVTNQVGFITGTGLTSATNNYGFYGNVPAGTNNWNIYNANTAPNYMAGALGIGTTSLTGFRLRVGGTVSEATPSGGVAYVASINGTFDSTVTAGAFGVRTALSTAASAFTAANVYHITADSLTIGAGSAATNQFGFYANSALTNATNNYGLYSAIPSGTNNWNLYASNTAPNYMAGSLGIGSTALSNISNLRIERALTGGTTQYSVMNQPTFQSDVTTLGVGYRSFLNTAAGAYTLSGMQHFVAEQGTIGAGSTVTDQRGYIAASSLIGATNNYGFYADIPAAANRWNFYANNTANNYMAGSLGIGATALTGYGLRVNKTLTGATASMQVSCIYTVASDVIGQARTFESFVLTQAAAFTLPNLYHFYVEGVSVGAGSTVTNQNGFYVTDLAGATNNYGFRGAVSSGVNKWNFYASGTADNAFNGNTRFGSTTAPVATVDVTGSVAATTSIRSSGGTSGIGYATGAGGTVTQNTSRTTPVTLDKVTGAITLTSAAGSASYQSFTVTNSAVAATDVVIVNQKSGTDKYITLVTNVAAGSFQITFATTGGTTTEQPVFNFAVIKAVTA